MSTTGEIRFKVILEYFLQFKCWNPAVCQFLVAVWWVAYGTTPFGNIFLLKDT